MMASISKSNDRCGDDTRPAPNEITEASRAQSRRGTGVSRLDREGDGDARNRLVQANLGLVVRVACDYKGRGLEMDDLIGEGNLGLIRAAEKFDPSFTIPFGTYARYWIKEKILAALSDTFPDHSLTAPHISITAQVAPGRKNALWRVGSDAEI